MLEIEGRSSIIEERRINEKAPELGLFQWLRGRFSSVTPTKTSRFCWAENCDYTCDFLEIITKHDDNIVLFYCRNMIDKPEFVEIIYYSFHSFLRMAY